MAIRPETDDLIDYLNELVAIDPDFMTALVATRHPCNRALVDHPTVQVGLDRGRLVAGILGVLNGFCGSYDDGPRQGWGAIAAIYDDAQLVRFSRVGNG
jgi:hypothetical protein